MKEVLHAGASRHREEVGIQHSMLVIQRANLP
jgi:hypothetical protein